MDDIGYQIATLQKQVAATGEQLTTANRSIDGQRAGLDAQICQVEDQMRQAVITSPIKGTVLSKYAEAGKTTELLRELGFENERKSMVGSLPLGWKQKLAFSLAIFHEPDIVFLDEPTGGVDPVTRRQFWELIYRAADRGITVFVTTHYMDEAEYCDRVSIMVDGRIEALGSPAQLKERFHGKTMYDVFYALARTARRGE